MLEPEFNYSISIIIYNCCTCMYTYWHTYTLYMHTHTHTALQWITCSMSLPRLVGPLVVVLFLSSPEVQLLVGPSSQLSVLSHIVQGPHIHPLVHHRPPFNGDVTTDKIISVDLFCTLLVLCCPNNFSIATCLGFHFCLWRCSLLACPSSPQHHSNSGPSNEQCEEQEGHHSTCQYYCW